ncbi:MAG: NAD(P)-dependent oxidoreductase [Candidatus Accumulibacter sp.]|jgi:GDP-L-fucose synthase|nr:NAD(P)-dependent oxidoreductase [Accumulibacter sp.]
MKHILLTGSTGFIGHNVLPLLRDRYDVAAPTRSELDLLDAGAVRRYLEGKQFDALIHLANPTARNPVDNRNELFERSLRVFVSLAHCMDFAGKMIYLGSGAEYGKHRALVKVTEDEFGRELPRDAYGLSRYLMSELAERCGRVTNLRLFGCHGPGDPPYKLIPHVLACVKKNRTIELRQNVMFDFLYVKDIVPVLAYFVENEPRHKAYNLCSGAPVSIGEIAEEARRQMHSDLPVVFQKEGLGLEYTGDNTRLRGEIPDWKPRSLIDGIREVIENQTSQI